MFLLITFKHQLKLFENMNGLWYSLELKITIGYIVTCSPIASDPKPTSINEILWIKPFDEIQGL